MAHLHSTHRVFNSRRGDLENTESIKTLGGWETQLGELTPLLGLRSTPSSKPHSRCQRFRLPASPLGAEATENPPPLPSYC